MDDYNKIDLDCQKPNVRQSRKRKSTPGVCSTFVAFAEELVSAYTKPPAYTVRTDTKNSTTLSPSVGIVKGD